MSATRDRLQVRDPFRYNNRQREAVWTADAAPPSSEILLDGSIRAGKTQAACRLLVAWAWKYPSTYVVSRMTYRELEDSTKKVICYGEAGLPPACPPELLKGSSLSSALHEGKNQLTLKTGSTILFRSLEPTEREKIRNMTLGGWLIDQAEELDDEGVLDFYRELKGRLSDPYGPRKVLLVANPSFEDHWISQRFGCVDGTPQKRCYRVHFTLFDNQMNLPADVVEDLLETEHTAPDFYKRMVLGLWGNFGGKRFKCWDPAVHVVRPFDIPSEWEIIEAWDYGWDHPTVATWHALDFEGRWRVVAEHVARETKVSDHAAAAKQIRENLRPDGSSFLAFHGALEPSGVYGDPSMFAKRSEHTAIATEFAEHGVYIARANNNRLGGWARLDEFLSNRLADGLPALQVFSTCPQVVKEIPNLRIKPGTDDVEKVKDDAADTCRYAITTRFPAPVFKLEGDEDAHSRRSLMARAMARSDARERGEELFTG